MKKVWQHLIISALCLLALPALAGNKNGTTRIAELDAMSNRELLTSVDLGKQADLVREFQKKEATRLINGSYNPKKTGANVETYRNKEVIIITIPSDKLFAPNDTELRSDVATYLQPLRRYMKPGVEDMYRVLLVMHTDNTGSEAYTDMLSLKRVDAVFRWLNAAGYNTTYVFPSASGASDPLTEAGTAQSVGEANDSMEKRAANRRLEIYLIPGKKMLDAAKKGQISY